MFLYPISNCMPTFLINRVAFSKAPVKTQIDIHLPVIIGIPIFPFVCIKCPGIDYFRNRLKSGGLFSRNAWTPSCDSSVL